jgi:hypothetical protein
MDTVTGQQANDSGSIISFLMRIARIGAITGTILLTLSLRLSQQAFHIR